MSLIVVQITIPNDKNIPDIISTFSPEENYLMLKIGSDTLREGRKVITNLTSDDVYRKIENDFKKDIEKLYNEIEMEKQTSIKMQEKIASMYECQIDQLNKKLENYISQIKVYEQGNSVSLQEEINKIKEKYDLMYREKENQVARMTDGYEKMLVQHQSSKSTSHKGTEGEKQFEDYANTFIDFKGFKIIDKHTQGGQGDFHLHFEEFDILVDAKNYKKKVPNDQREKIKKDLIKNEHINFGWLVSLNTSIDKFDRAPIMYEWVNTTQCLVYINNLTSFEDPAKILRIVWFTCKELSNMVKEVDYDEEELTQLKNDRFKLMDKIRNLRKNIREINTSINATKNLIQVMDDELRGLLENETDEIVNSNISLFDDWWESNIEIVEEEIVSASTDLWTKFKQDNRVLISDMNITGDKFKQYLKSKVPMSAILLRNKNANSAFDIKGIRLKEDVFGENKVVEEKLELELNEDVVNKKKKIVKKKPEIYFSQELDSKILNEYFLQKDIIDISKINNVKPWQVVSVLMRYKIIKKRDDALGYDKYKETDDYKQKIKESKNNTIDDTI
jgi:hypothetical protein